MDFNISFQKSTQELTELLIKMGQLGGVLDANDLKATKTGSRLVEGLSKVVAEIQKVTQAYEQNANASGSAEAQAQAMGQVAQRAARIMEQLGQAHTASAVKASALKGELGGLQNIMQETAVMQSYIRWQEKQAAMLVDLTQREKYLSQQLAATATAESKGIAVLQQRLRTAEQMAAAEQKLTDNLKLTSQALQLATSADAQALSQAKQKLRNIEQQAAAEEALAGRLQSTQLALQQMNSADGKALAVASEKLRYARQQASEDERRASTMQTLSSQLTYLNSAEGKREAQMRVEVAQQRKLNDEEAKAALGIDSHAKASQRLTEQQAKQIAQQRELEQATKAANEASVRASMSQNYGGRPYTRSVEQTVGMATGDASNAALRSQLAQTATFGRESASLHVNTVTEANSAAREAQLANAIKIRNDLTRVMAESQRKLTAEEAATIVKTEQLAAATNKANQAQIEGVKAAQGISNAQMAVSRSIEQETQKLADLRARRESLSGVEGRVLRSMREQVAAEQERVNALEGVTRATGRYVTANNRLTASLDGSAQAGAAFRASLAGFKSSFGSFAGSTLLVASGFYAVSTAMRNLVADGMEYQKSLSRIQALTANVGENSEAAAMRMSRVNAAVRTQAIESIYNAKETAEGFQYLVQSGMNADTAIKSLPATLSMASVSMLSMKEAADITTNIMSGFRLEADQMPHVVDMMARAVTRSNTTMQELGNALSYIGPSAETAGYAIEDVTAAIEVLANNGIKGSRAGTGLRGVITGLIEPSTQGKQKLMEMGIAVDDMDGKTRALTDVFDQLHAQIEDLPKAEQLKIINQIFGRYAQSAASVLIEQNSALAKFKAELLKVDGVAKGMADTIRDNLSGAWENMTSARDDVMLETFNGFEPMFKAATMAANEFFLSFTNEDIQSGVARVANTFNGLFTQVQNLSFLLPAIKWTALSVAGGMAFKSIANLSSQAITGVQQFGATVSGISSHFERLRATAFNSLQSTNNIAGTTGTTMVNSFRAATTAALRTADTVGVLRIAMSGLQAVAGWIGTALTLGTAIYTAYHMWFSDSKDEMKDYGKLLDEMITKQKGYNDLINRDEKRRERESMEGELAKGEQRLQTLTDKYEALRQEAEKGAGGEAIKSAMQQAAEDITTVKNAIDALRTSLGQLNNSTDGISVDSGGLAEAALERKKAQESVDEYKNAGFAKQWYWDNVSPSMDSTGGMRQLRLEDANKKLADAENLANKNRTNTATGAPTTADEADSKYKQGIDDITKKSYADARARDSLNTKLTKAYKQRDELIENAKKGRGGQTRTDEFEKSIGALDKTIAELEDQKNSQDTRIRKLERGDKASSPDQLRRDLAAANKRADEARKSGDNDALAPALEERNQILSQLEALRKQSGKDAKKDAEELKKAADVYNKMVESLDDGTLKATRVFEERRTAIGKLFQEGSVGYTAAMVENRKAFNRELAKQDQYYKDPKALVSGYTGKSERTQADVDRKALQERADALRGMDFSNDSGRDAEKRLTDRALELAKQKQSSTLRDGLDLKSSSADLGTFQSAYDGVASVMERNASFAKRGNDLDVERDERLQNSSSVESQQSTVGMTEEQQHEMHRKFEEERLAITQEYVDKHKELEQIRADSSQQSMMQVSSAIANSASTTLSSLSGMAKEGSGLQKGLLVASRAFHYAQMALSIESAAAQITSYGGIAAAAAGASAASAGPAASASAMAAVQTQYATLAAMTRIMGYANLAMTAISDVSSSSDSGSSSSSSSTTETKKNVTFSGFKDKGGAIGSDEWAIVGEYGPEIVQGPANVTSRAETAAAARDAMGGSNRQAVQITIAPTVNVHSDGSSTDADARRQGEITADTITQIAKQAIQDELEHGGILAGSN